MPNGTVSPPDRGRVDERRASQTGADPPTCERLSKSDDRMCVAHRGIRLLLAG
jgi:hypothetical protein